MKISIPKYVALFVLAICSFSCADDNNTYQEVTSSDELQSRLIALYGSVDALVLPMSDDYANIPEDSNNPITQAKVELGKFLYHETGFASNSMMEEGRMTYSCASCHHVAAGFQSGLQQGIGDGGIGFGIRGEARTKSPMYADADIDVQPIRTPSVLNAAYQDVMLWNGQFGAVGTNEGTEANWTLGTPKETNNLGFEGVEIQAIAGLDVHRMAINEETVTNLSYKELFDNAFPDIPINERYSNVTAGLAIAAYERTLLPNQSPFQEWLRGNTSVMTEEETKGALLFFDKGKCYSCHSGPGLNGMDFHALGMNDLSGPGISTTVDEGTKKGRGGFTGNSDDDYKFKTPQLYNLMDVQFYGHGGSFTSVKDVIEYKNEAVHENLDVPANKLSPLFEPLGLTADEIDMLTAFIENALYDNNLNRYVPDELMSGNCFPNADEQSMEDMGCE